MALLDKQKILNELENVVSQLQRADCGCMGKIFGNNNNNSSCADHKCCMAGQCGGEMRNCWSHGGYGYNSQCAGEPFARQCGGFCSPSPKLYADTFNYVNKHLMQPTINEVYHDLKSLTPANTVMNNPLAAQMGLSRAGTPNRNMIPQNGMSPQQYGAYGASDMSNSNYSQDMYPMGQGMGQMRQGMGQMGQGMGQMDYGMGQMGYGMGQMGQGASPMDPYTKMMEGMGPQIVNMMQSKTDKPSHRNMQNPQEMGQAMPYMPESQDDTWNKPMNMSQSDMYPGRNVSHNNSQQMGGIMNHGNGFGNLSAGMGKFTDMFPDRMKQDLGYDPMSIALQMNPNNAQYNPMSAMQKMMTNSNDKRMDSMPMMHSMANVQNPAPTNVARADQVICQNESMQPQKLRTINEMPNMSNQPELDRPEGQGQYQQEPQRQQYEDATAPAIPYEASERRPRSPSPRSPSPVYQDPIFPAVLNKKLNQPPQHYTKPPVYFEYNPLGQLVERVSPINPREIPNYRQNLPAQPRVNNQAKIYSNVKSTVSKTSLMGNTPVGKVPSRSQLQNIYNQYKGSHSFTKQSIGNKQTPNTVSYSEGNIKLENARNEHVALERVGGDTVAEKHAQPVSHKQDPNMKEVVGDVPQNNKPSLDTKTRNGLQDQVFTSPPASSKWTFHGVHTKPYTSHRRRRRW